MAEICPARKQAVTIAQLVKYEWRERELELQKTKEALAREEEEETEKAQKERAGRREVAVVVEILRRNKKEVAMPVKRDGEDGDLNMRDQNATPESAGLKALRNATLAATNNTPPVNAYTTT